MADPKAGGTAVPPSIDEAVAANVPLVDSAEAPTQLLPPRKLVPTPRQLGDGERPVEPEPVAEVQTDPKDSRRSRGENARAYFKGADPRMIGSPRLPIAVFGLMFLIGSWDDSAVQILIPEWRAEFGLDVRFLVGLLSAGAIISDVSAPLMGYLADRVKRVWLIRTAALLQNLSSVLTGIAPGIGALAGARVMAITGNSLALPVQGPLIADYYRQQVRIRCFTFLAMCGAAGGVAGPVVAGALAEAFGWRTAIIALGGLALVASIGTFFLKEPVRGYQERKEMGADEELAAKQPEPLGFVETWRIAASITTVRRFWYASLFLPAANIGNLFILLLLAEQGLGPQQRGNALALAGVAVVIALPLAGSVADRLLQYRPGRVLVLLGFVKYLQAAAFVVAAFAPAPWIVIAMLVPATFSSVIINPATFGLYSLVLPARIRGLGMQTGKPFVLASRALIPAVLFGLGPLFEPLVGSVVRGQMIALALPTVVAGLIVSSAAGGVARDIRSAQAAALAGEASRLAREQGRSKMLVCRDLNVSYDGTQVLFGVDFDVEEGELVALLGTNGAGKSTLMRAIAGVHDPSGGAVFLDGEDVTHEPAHLHASRGVVMVPGGHAVFPGLTVAENLQATAWAASNGGAPGDRLEEVLDLFPVLRERLDQPAGNLSGGEQQMLALSQALMMQPRLLLIDELSLGLAPQVVAQLLATLREIHARGTTIVLIEQSLNVATTIARRAVFMEKGQIRFDGPTQELLGRPELVRAVFMGGAAGGGGSRAVARPVASEHAPATQLLSLEDVQVSFGGVSALRGVSFDVRPGEIVGIIGPNGAGKTTLFDVISGFVPPDEGRVVLDGQDVTSLSPDARARLGLGRSFQNARLFPGLTCRENIAVAMERRVGTRSVLLSALWAPQVRSSERIVARRVDALIEILGLGAYADKFVNELSTGTRRTVDVACIMAAQPKILLLDEPSSGLAQAETEELGPVIHRIARDADCSIVVIEHDLGLVSSVSDRMLAMELGAVIATGTPHEVVNDPRVVSAYLADALTPAHGPV